MTVGTSNPQSWNRYAYVTNNPMNLVDPYGLNDCEDHSDCGDGGFWAGPQPGQCLFGECDDNPCWFDFWGGDCGATQRMFGGFGYNGGPPWIFCDPNLDPSCGPRSWCDPGIDLNCILPIYLDLNLSNRWWGFNTPPPKPTKIDRLITLNSCVDPAASAKNSQLWGAAGKNLAGGATILTVVGLGGAILPELYAEAGASEGMWASYHAFEVTGRFAAFTIPGDLVYEQGIWDATNALNNFDLAVAGCQAQTGYPNVP